MEVAVRRLGHFKNEATEHTETTRLVSFRLARLCKVIRCAAVVGTFRKLIAQSAHRSQLTTRKHKQ